MNNDVFTLDENNNAAIRTVGVNGVAESNSPSVFTQDENGNACIRVTGSGGGDQHNLGYFATQAALEEAYPTATAGDWAIVGSTDTVWIWDTDNEEWVDSDQKGQVTSVNGQTGAVTLTASDVDALPQYTTMPTASSANAGEIAQYVGTTNASYTNGYIYKNETTSASATGTQTEGTGLTAITVSSPAVFASAFETGFETPIPDSEVVDFEYDGFEWAATADSLSATIFDVDITAWGITYTGTPQAYDVISVAYTAASYAWNRIDVQPASDPLPSQTGNAGKVLMTNGTTASWEDVSSSPATMPTLAVADWSLDSGTNKYTQSVSVTGVTGTNTVFVSPAPSSAADYASSFVLCISQTTDSLTFQADSIPSNAITVNVVIMG